MFRQFFSAVTMKDPPFFPQKCIENSLPQRVKQIENTLGPLEQMQVYNY